MVLTDDGRMVYVADLVDAAEQRAAADAARRRRTGRGQTRCSRTCSRSRSPARARWSLAARRPGRPAAWGGANAAYDPGSIAAGPFPTGPLLPTALGLGTPPLLDNAQALFDDGNGDADQGLASQAPTLNATGTIEREAGSITVTPLFASAGPLPALGEAARLPDAQINGVDQRNLTVGQSGDAAIVFGSEFAAFVNTLGVFLIRPNGEMVDPKIVFPEIEQAEPDPDFPIPAPAAARSRQASRSCSAICTIRPSCSRDRNSVCS